MYEKQATLLYDESSPLEWYDTIRRNAPLNSFKIHSSDDYMFFYTMPRGAGFSVDCDQFDMPENGARFVFSSLNVGVCIDLTNQTYRNIIKQLTTRQSKPTPWLWHPDWMEAQSLLVSIQAIHRILIPNPDLVMLRTVLKTLAMASQPSPLKFKALIKQMRIEAARCLREGDTTGLIAAAIILEQRASKLYGI